MDKALVVALIYGGPYEIAFYSWWVSFYMLGGFELSLMHSLTSTEDVRKIHRKMALLSFHIACAIYIREYAHCPSGTGPSVWDAVGCSGGRRSQDAPCQLLSLNDLACSFGLSTSPELIFKHYKHSENDGCVASDACIRREVDIHQQSCQCELFFSVSQNLRAA